jgi:hypothetical protein
MCQALKVMVPLPAEAPLPALEGRFRCERCGSRQTSARPHFEEAGAMTRKVAL